MLDEIPFRQVAERFRKGREVEGMMNDLSPNAQIIFWILFQAKELGINDGCLTRDEIVSVASNCKLTPREIMNADHDTLIELFLPIFPG